MSARLPTGAGVHPATFTGHTADVANYFDGMYGKGSVWWNRPGEVDTRLSADPNDHLNSLITNTVLRRIKENGLVIPRVLDVFSGEGVDGVRYALMGYEVTMVEVALKGLDRTWRLAKDNNVEDRITLIHGSAQEVDFGDETFGYAYSHGGLDYVESDEDKERILSKLQRAVPVLGYNSVACWMHEPPQEPECHKEVPMFPDIDGKITFGSYLSNRGWLMDVAYAEYGRIDTSHPGEFHSHDHAKLLAQRVA